MCQASASSSASASALFSAVPALKGETVHNKGVSFGKSIHGMIWFGVVHLLRPQRPWVSRHSLSEA